MTSFWPDGIELTDTQSPLDILTSARNDWMKHSNGQLTLVLQQAKSQSGNDLIVVHAKHIPSNRTATLFSVVHRPNAPYPATIQPKGDDLPQVLKKSYLVESGLRALGMYDFSKERTVTNEWVSDSPSEFRLKLGKVINLGIVKSEILSLVSANSTVSRDSDEDLPTPPA